VTARSLAIAFSSAEDDAHPGAYPYNGGMKLYNIWRSALVSTAALDYAAGICGYGRAETSILTAGDQWRNFEWLTYPGGILPIDDFEARLTASPPDALRLVTFWLPSKALIDLARRHNQPIYYYDHEIRWTIAHRTLLDQYLHDGLLAPERIAVHTTHTAAWYMAHYNFNPTHIPQVIDTDLWSNWVTSQPERDPPTLGYIVQDNQSLEYVGKILHHLNINHPHLSPIRIMEIHGSESQVAAQMQQCHIYLSLHQGKHPLWGEGCPIPGMEAMAAGCIVVAFDVIGNRAYLRHNYNGYLVSNGDWQAMADRIAAILTRGAFDIENDRLRGLDYLRRTHDPYYNTDLPIQFLKWLRL